MLECRHEKEINSNHRSFDKEDKIMEYRYPHLCSPITLGNTTFKSRIFSAPMGGTDITADCCIGPKSTKFYELRAKGGAAAVTVSECMVHPETDGSHAYHLDLSVPGSLPSFTYTADALSSPALISRIRTKNRGWRSGDLPRASAPTALKSAS